jgi:predicted DNA-binding transcriptional regulator YafY
MRVSIAEAAKMLRVSEHTIRRRLAKGELMGVQVAMGTGGFQWMVDLPDELQMDTHGSGEIVALRELITTLNDQVEALRGQLESKDRQMETKDSQLESKDRQIEQLHVLLQQAQAALPAPSENQHSWWYKLWNRNGR